LINDLQFANALKHRTDMFLYCDGAVERVSGTRIDAYPKISQCEKWAAVPTAILRAHAASLTSQATSQIFVAPFALSSLSVTLFVYVTCFLLIYTAGIRALVPKLASRPIVTIESIPLTLAACAVFAFFFTPLTVIVIGFSVFRNL
jgi:hypothetical protein